VMESEAATAAPVADDDGVEPLELPTSGEPPETDGSGPNGQVTE
jgi:hypothetical protein